MIRSRLIANHSKTRNFKKKKLIIFVLKYVCSEFSRVDAETLPQVRHSHVEVDIRLVLGIRAKSLQLVEMIHLFYQDD